MKKDLISIIVPVYNVEKYLKRCIESIINQTYKNIEIILVDDGSQDNSGNICDSYSIKDGRIKVIHKKNGGLSDARNVGIKNANGEYIGFVDSDDYIAEDMYEYLLKVMKDNNSDISVCNYKKVIEKNSEKEKNENNNKDNCVVLNSYEALKYIVVDKELQSYAWNKLYKIELFKNVEYPIGLAMEDIATTYKLIYNSNIVAIGNQIKYYYVQREGSILHSKTSKFYENYFKIMYERYLFYINKNLRYDIIYISMIKFILSLYLIVDKDVDEFRKRQNIKQILKNLVKQCKYENIKLDSKIILRYNTLLTNETIYRIIFRRYIKWVAKLNPQELL